MRTLGLEGVWGVSLVGVLAVTSGCQWVLGFDEHHLGTLDGETGGVGTVAGASATAGTEQGGTTTRGGTIAQGGTTAQGGVTHGTDPGFCVTSGADVCEDFEPDSTNVWAQFDQYGPSPGNWVSSMTVDPLGLNTFSLSQTSNNAGYHFYVERGTAAGDQSVTAWIRPDTLLSDDSTKVGVCARVSGTSFNTLGWYCLFLRNYGLAQGYIQLSKKLTGGFPTSIDGVIINVQTYATATWYKVTLECTGKTVVQLRGYVNNELVISRTDSPATLTEGSVGLVTRTGTSASPVGLATFDNVTVTVL